MSLQEESAPQALAPNRVFRTPAPQASAPSEVVLLNGEQFAMPVPKEIGRSWFVPQRTRLLHKDTAVSTSELIVAVIRAALLALEGNGDVKLKVEKVGIISRQYRLIIEQGSVWDQWPQGSLEERIGQALESMSSAWVTGDLRVADLIGVIVDEKFWQSFLVEGYVEPYLLSEMVEALVTRGIADYIPGESERYSLFVKRPTRAHLSEAGQRAVADYDLEEVRQLLLRYKQKRPALWSRLDEEIVGGLVSALSVDWLGD